MMSAAFSFLLQSKKRARICAALWTLMILVACLIPGRDVPDVSIPLIDKWVHFVIFGGFSFLWLATFRKVRPAIGVIVFLLAVALGYAVELLQGSGITSGRSYDMMDVLADSIGGALGVFLFFGLLRWTERKSGRS